MGSLPGRGAVPGSVVPAGGGQASVLLWYMYSEGAQLFRSILDLREETSDVKQVKRLNFVGFCCNPVDAMRSAQES